ncbi:hypothetical protein [Kitasatospora fiedleri]|uniref:hypothetical protein n=1 Tax=Kitasatospora fiedleri TaxID=2991545 RepID=UPI00249B9D72|nr:hypothetical protein [Kitasatospora fiedleri]
MTVTVRLDAGPGVPAWCDRHLAARTDEPARVRHLADVLYGEHPGGSAEEVWRRHPGCAVLALRDPGGLVHVRFRGGTLTLRPPAAGSTTERTAADGTGNGNGTGTGTGTADPAALAGSLVHALLSAARARAHDGSHGSTHGDAPGDAPGRTHSTENSATDR